MDKTEWLARCSARFDMRVQDPAANWEYDANACWDTMHEDFPDDPEGAADEEMLCWDE